MPRFERPFKIQLPVITLPVSHGARPAIVLLSFAPAGVKDPQHVLTTAISIDGRLMQEVPMHVSALKAAALNPMTFVETDDLIQAPAGGLILPGR